MSRRRRYKPDGLNTLALQQVVDIETLENGRGCGVNEVAAVIGEYEGRIYLCWTLDPENSCLIEYSFGSLSEEDIFWMAESVLLPQGEKE